MNRYIDDFPALKTKANGKRLVYLDNAATTQKPVQVIHAIRDYYEKYNANPHRGSYYLSLKATEIYENARETVRRFIGADKTGQVIFTKNTTESLNLVAYSYGMNFVEKGDEIVVLISEHHSNLIPWQRVARAKGAVLKFMYINDDGVLTDDEIEAKITDKAKIVALAHVSNVIGIVNPIEKVIKKAHEAGAVVVLDCAQSIPHFSENVKDLDADFVAFSGHKMLAPMGIGVLYGKEELLEKMPPFLSGGDMIEYVYEQETTFAPLPAKFEAGTQNVEAAFGLAEAIRYIENIGYEDISKAESGLINYAYDQLSALPFVTVYGGKNENARCGLLSFNVNDVHPHDAASILDNEGIAIRSGFHCAQPLLRYLGVNATCRASFYFYNTTEDVDALVEGLKKVRKVLNFGS